MQIVPFRAHCQSVCTNFDFSSFSRISCSAMRICQQRNTYLAVAQYVSNSNGIRIAQQLDAVPYKFICCLRKISNLFPVNLYTVRSLRGTG